MPTETFPSRSEWLNYRKSRIGASDAAVILGESHFSSPYKLWCEKVGLVKSDEMGEAQEWGLVIEKSLADWFKLKTPHLIEPSKPFTVNVHPEYPWMIATTDSTVYHVERDRLGPCQFKNVGLWNKGEWDIENGKAPDFYMIQLQHEIAVMEAEFGFFCVSIGGQAPVIFEVPRDDRFIGLMIPYLKEFQDAVVNEIAPPVDGTEHTTDAIKKRFPKVIEDSVVLPWEAKERYEKRLELKAKEKEIKDALNEHDNWFKNEIGGAEVGTAGGFKVSYKTIERKATVVKASTFRKLHFSESKETC